MGMGCKLHSTSLGLGWKESSSNGPRLAITGAIIIPDCKLGKKNMHSTGDFHFRNTFKYTEKSSMSIHTLKHTVWIENHSICPFPSCQISTSFKVAMQWITRHRIIEKKKKTRAGLGSMLLLIGCWDLGATLKSVCRLVWACRGESLSRQKSLEKSCIHHQRDDYHFLITDNLQMLVLRKSSVHFHCFVETCSTGV